MTVVLAIVAAALAAALVYFVLRSRAAEQERDAARQEWQAAQRERDAAATANTALTNRFQGIVDADAERLRVQQATADERAKAERDVAALRSWLATSTAEAEAVRHRTEALQAKLDGLEEKEDLMSAGYYEPHFDFDTSERYKKEIEKVRESQKRMIKEGSAAFSPTDWTVNGSLKEGAKMVKQNVKVLLRAFNGECDAAIANVRFNNFDVMERRIENSFDSVNALGTVTGCSINPRYLILKKQELRLAHEYAEKKQAEKEEQRAIREQMREEEKAQREFEQAQREAEKEERRYADALEKARRDVELAEGAKREKLAAQIEELERRLAEAATLRERAIARAQLTRSGHVYVISNVGSFGEHVFKIGMTRRLDPMERVRELGDASVPFAFDVHAIIYSDDAPALEAQLHRAFARRRVNRINERREFFRVTLAEIERVVKASHAEIEFTKLAEASDYRKTLALLRHEHSDDEIASDEAFQAPSFLDLLRREARADAETHDLPALDALTPALPLEVRGA